MLPVAESVLVDLIAFQGDVILGRLVDVGVVHTLLKINMPGKVLTKQELPR